MALRRAALNSLSVSGLPAGFLDCVSSSTLQSVGWKLSFPTTDFCTRALRAIDLDAHFFQTAASNDR